MVTGSIEKGETAVQAAIREIQEETGLKLTKLYSADAVETFYMPANDKINFVPVFVGFTEEIDVKLSDTEHDAFEWLSFEEAKKRLAWAEQRRILAHVHEFSVRQKPNDLLLCPMTPHHPK
jgi:dATP pyrophosphohydrolase